MIRQIRLGRMGAEGGSKRNITGNNTKTKNQICPFTYMHPPLPHTHTHNFQLTFKPHKLELLSPSIRAILAHLRTKSKRHDAECFPLTPAGPIMADLCHSWSINPRIVWLLLGTTAAGDAFLCHLLVLAGRLVTVLLPGFEP